MEFFLYTISRMFIDHLKVSGEFETSDLDLDLQGQIYHESLNVCVIICECDNFEPLLIYPLNMNSVLIIYITHATDEFKTGALDLDH